jgi:ubiquitin-like 1-activating enzyme E1 B
MAHGRAFRLYCTADTTIAFILVSLTDNLIRSGHPTTMASPYAALEATLGKPLLEKIQTSKILLVGSGGIGCELLKNLALSGFRYVEVIDLDTIDVSNLNRQFLFRSQHVGKSKCEVACSVAQNMVPVNKETAKYIPHHGNVCDNSKFNVQYVSGFALVLNALDNVTARRRVNRLCLAANVPLVEAGTTGYLGQVKVIDKASNLACYECATQETQKVYPICTIRSTPSMPVHTIVWAKELYKLLFGAVAESMLFEDPNGEEPSTYMAAVAEYRALLEKKAPKESLTKAAVAVLTHLCTTEINKQLSMDRYKTAKTVPTALDPAVIEASLSLEAPTKRASYKTTDVWSQADCIAEFISCLADTDDHPAPLLESFDKDDMLAMKLVTAGSNLRSDIFGIEPLQSFYSAKGIAGNIVPAIATTNAIVAGLQVLQVFHILREQLEGREGTLGEVCKYVDCLRNKMGRPGYFLSSSKLDQPNPKCFVCRNATIPLTLNVEKWTLQDLLTKVIKKDLGFEEPTLMLDGDMIYEEGEDADTDAFAPNLVKVLTKLPCGGIQNGTILRVEDFSQDLEVDVCITHQEVWEKEEGETDEDAEKYVIGGEKPKAVAAVAAGDEDKKSAAVNDADDDDIEVLDIDDVDEEEDSKPAASGKRKSENGEENGEPAAKKAKTDEDDGIIVLD